MGDDTSSTEHGRQIPSSASDPLPLLSVTYTVHNMPAPETHITLPSGDRMPSIGLGCWQSPKEELVKAVQHALQVGYRHIDGATIYGNEESLGEGIRLSDIARKDIWVTTKLWNSQHSSQQRLLS